MIGEMASFPIHPAKKQEEQDKFSISLKLVVLLAFKYIQEMN